MGGVAGIVHFRGGAPSREVAQAMSDAVAHRGPDDAGYWAEGPAILMQRRFRTSDTGRRQPIAANPWVLVMDGTVYDTGALQNELEGLGIQPRTGGDADHVLAAWQAWRSDTVSRLMGDFALAVWNRQDRVLTLASDPVGVRPLYYASRDGLFAFASDVRALLRVPWVSRTLATEDLAEYLSFRYTHAPRTLLRDVRLLPAGHIARVDATGVRLHRYWSPHWALPSVVEPSEADTVRSLDNALQRAVDRRLVGGEEVGVLLSGGSSSASILRAVARRQVPRTFNVSFADGGLDEASFAGRVAKLFDAEHTTVRVSREDFAEALPKVVEFLGQPLPSPAAVLQYIVAREARKEVRVLLSGDGADELLGGPAVASLARVLRASRVAGRLPEGLRRPLVRASGGRLGEPEQFGLSQLVGGSRVFDTDERMSILRDPALVRPGMQAAMLGPLYSEVDTDSVNEMLHVYLRGWLPEDSLLRSDRTSTAAGVEVRYPLLDTDLVDFLTGLPGRAKIKRRRGTWYDKWPLKRLLEPELPARLVWRPKRGIPSPLDRWLRDDGEAFLWDHVESVCEDPLGLFRKDAIRRLAREHAAGRASHGAHLWALFFFDLWYRTLSDPPSSR